MRVLRIGPPSPRRGDRPVTLEGGTTLRLPADDLAALGLEPGADLDPDRLAALRHRAERARALESAVRLLAVRPRSRAELAERLRRRGVSAAVTDEVMACLRAEGLLDDVRFARLWIQDRLTLRPSGALRLRSELLRKGVAPEVVEQALREALPETDERRLAVEVARARFHRYRSQPAEVALRRLAGVLQRRGFRTAIVTAALNEVFRGRRPVVE